MGDNRSVEKEDNYIFREWNLSEKLILKLIFSSITYYILQSTLSRSTEMEEGRFTLLLSPASPLCPYRDH